MKDIRELSSAARHAVESKRLDGNWEIGKLLKLLGELRQWDAHVETRKATAERLKNYSLIALVACVFLGGVLAAILEEFWVFATAAGLPLIALLLMLRWKRALRAIDVPDEIRLTVEPLLRKLRADVAGGERIRVRMDLSGLHDAKAGPKQTLPGRGRVHSIDQTAYADAVCDLRLPLTDGSEAVLAIHNTFIKQLRKQSGTRKTKYKTLWRKRSAVTASIIPPGPVAWNQARLETVLERRVERVRILEKDGLRIASLRRQYKFKSAGDLPSDAVAPAKEVLGMFLRLRLHGT